MTSPQAGEQMNFSALEWALSGQLLYQRFEGGGVTGQRWKDTALPRPFPWTASLCRCVVGRNELGGGSGTPSRAQVLPSQGVSLIGANPPDVY